MELNGANGAHEISVELPIENSEFTLEQCAYLQSTSEMPN